MSRASQRFFAALALYLFGLAIIGALVYLDGTKTRSHTQAKATVTVTASAPAALPRRSIPRSKVAPEGPFVGTITNIHDGDTLTLVDQLGFNVKFQFNCRVKGINAPELSTQAGKDALAYAQTKIHVGDQVINYSYGPDKFGGRDDCTLTEPDGTDFGKDMIDSGHAVPYNP